MSPQIDPGLEELQAAGRTNTLPSARASSFLRASDFAAPEQLRAAQPWGLCEGMGDPLTPITHSAVGAAWLGHSPWASPCQPPRILDPCWLSKGPHPHECWSVGAPQLPQMPSWASEQPSRPRAAPAQRPARWGIWAHLCSPSRGDIHTRGPAGSRWPRGWGGLHGQPRG